MLVFGLSAPIIPSIHSKCVSNNVSLILDYAFMKNRSAATHQGKSKVIRSHNSFFTLFKPLITQNEELII